MRNRNEHECVNAPRVATKYAAFDDLLGFAFSQVCWFQTFTGCNARSQKPHIDHSWEGAFVYDCPSFALRVSRNVLMELDRNADVDSLERVEIAIGHLVLS